MMKGSPSVPPAGCLLPLLLLLFTGVSGEVSWFSVKGPAEPITVLLGTEATLPCQLSPEQSAARMHIRWYRAQPTPAVLVFHNGQEQGEVQMPEYRGRTQMVRQAIDMGSVALQIQQVQASDDGLYHCQFTDGFTSQEVSMELRVIGLGSAPLVHMTGPENDGIRVLCSSSGWFPKPKVQWRDTSGNMLLSSSELQTQDREGLFQVEVSLLVTDRAIGNVICSIQNPMYDQEKSKAILLPEPFFPKTCPWKVALVCSVLILLVLLGGISLGIWKEHQVKRREIKKWSKEHEEMLLLKKGTKSVLKIRDDLQADLDRRKALYKEDWKKALLYPDWRKELFQEAPVRINYEMPDQDKTDSRTEENRDPLRKFRVLEKNGDGYRALDFCSQNINSEEPLQLKTRPLKIAIFLDQEDNDLSFYNMTDETHIFSFAQVPFLGSPYPYFTRNSMGLSATAQP